jgi:oxidase EvaA
VTSHRWARGGDAWLPFAKSLMANDGSLCSNQAVTDWISEEISRTHVRIERVGLAEMGDWGLDDRRERITHRTGRFFSIDGIHVAINDCGTSSWFQPIINQPEVGFLGCIAREHEGVIYLLVQAKIEPGNINVAQLSPTLQATRSNYTRQHGGRAPMYLEYFRSDSKKVLTDQLQSEQGSRFLKKRNRNIIITVDSEIPYNSQFRWLTIGQIKLFCQIDNMVNMDLRTVVSALPIDEMSVSADFTGYVLDAAVSETSEKLLMSLSGKIEPCHDFCSLLSWITEIKSNAVVTVKKIPLSHLDGWRFDEEGVCDSSKKSFDVRWVSVEIANREVASWKQPILQPHEKSVFAFIIKEFSGTPHFLVQAKIECGLIDILELGPTVQCSESEFRESACIPFAGIIREGRQTKVLYDTLQSEEGGRFLHDENRYMVLLADDDLVVPSHERYRWMTLSQILQFMKFSNYVNIQARVLIGALRFG